MLEIRIKSMRLTVIVQGIANTNPLESWTVTMDIHYNCFNLYLSPLKHCAVLIASIRAVQLVFSYVHISHNNNKKKQLFFYLSAILMFRFRIFSASPFLMTLSVCYSNLVSHKANVYYHCKYEILKWNVAIHLADVSILADVPSKKKAAANQRFACGPHSR